MHTKQDELLDEINGFFDPGSETASVFEPRFDKFMGFIHEAYGLKSLRAIDEIIDLLKKAGTKHVGVEYRQGDGNVNLSFLRYAAEATKRLILTAPAEESLWQNQQRILRYLEHARVAVTSREISAGVGMNEDTVIRVLGTMLNERVEEASTRLAGRTRYRLSRQRATA